MHPISGQHLYDAYPSKDTRRKRIKRTDGYDGRFVVSVERSENTDADCHSDGCDECEGGCHDRLFCERCSLGWEASNACSEGHSFEHLVEDDDGEEGEEERVAGDHERKTDE